MSHIYRIQQKISTPIILEQKMECSGYTLEPYNGVHNRSGDITAIREISSADWRSAARVFLEELEPVVNALAIFTQTIVYPLATATIYVYRMTENSERLFFAQVRKMNPANGMNIGPESTDDLQKLSTSSDDFLAMVYLRDSISAFSSTQKLAMLHAAVEAFTNGTKNSEPIIGKELCEKLYGKDGLRNRVSHGKYVFSNTDIKITNELSKKLFDYIKAKYPLDSMTVLSEPRSWNFEYSHCGCKVLDTYTGIPTLQQIESEWETSSPTVFGFLPSLPEDY